MANIDFEADVNNPPTSEESLKQVIALAKEKQQLEQDIELMEARLKDDKAKLHRLSTADIPDLMQTLGLSKFSLSDGSEVVVKDHITGNIPSKSAIENSKLTEEERLQLIERRKAAFEWLRKNRHEALIKNEVSLTFGKGEAEKAKEVVALLQKAGHHPHVEEQVHPQTLGAFLREQLEKGTAIPMETFKVYKGKVAEIAIPKVKKPSNKSGFTNPPRPKNSSDI